MEIKKIKLVPHDPSWKKIFAEEKALLLKALENNVITIEHIGSTAIPKLDAKPKIDIVAEVHDPEKSIIQLALLGYEYRGEFNIPLHWGFAKRGKIDFNLHIYHEENPEIELNIAFRDWLLSHPEDRQEYQTLKHTILKNPDNLTKDNPFFARYTLEKGLFIKKILKKVGFKRNRILFCADEEEWKEYQRIKQREIFDPVHIIYDAQHTTLTDPDHFHFIIYQGATIVGIAHIQFFEKQHAILRALAVDTRYQKNGIGTFALQQLEQWLTVKHKKTLFLHSYPNAYTFYLKNGYMTADFSDTSIKKTSIKMKKNL